MKYIILLLLLLIPIVYAADPAFIFPRDENATISVPCHYRNVPCTNTTACNLTSYSPKGALFIDSEAMTYHNGGFVYNISDTSKIGDYNSIIYCSDGAHDGSYDFFFRITGSYNRTVNALTIVIGLGIVAGLLLWLIFSLSDEHMLLKILFLILDLFIIIYMIPLSLLSEDIVYATFKWMSNFWYLVLFYILIYPIYMILNKYLMKQQKNAQE